MGILTGGTVFDALSIILVNILLSGDNAVVIAMAVKSLPARQRKIGIGVGTGAAAVLRIVLTFFAGQLLDLKFVQLIGGAVILWIAVQLLAEDVEDKPDQPRPGSVWAAVRTVIVADVTMSLDNILAIAGLAKGNFWLLVFGLALSIAFVVFASSLLATFMDRYPVIVYIGAAILGRLGAEMMESDPWVASQLHLPRLASIAIQAFFALAVVVVGWWLARRSKPSVQGPESAD